MLHLDTPNTPPSSLSPAKPDSKISSNAAASLAQNSLRMTCKVLVKAPDGSTMTATALLDSALSASFISERLVKGLCFPRLHQNTTISGEAGLTSSSCQALINVSILSAQTNSKFSMANVVPRITCDLAVHPVAFSSTCTHIYHVPLVDPDFGCPQRVDILLRVDIFMAALLQVGGLDFLGVLLR